MERYVRLLLVVLVVAVGAAIWAVFLSDGGWRSDRSETPVATTLPAENNDTKTEADAQEAADSTEADGQPTQPAFDVVRVEDSGEMVVAGVAPPGWTVRVETPERVIGEVDAGFDGSWVLLPDAPLPVGDHSLSVTARRPDGSRTVRGAERVAVSVSPDSTPAVVALSQENRATRVLQSGQADATATESIPQQDKQPVAFSAVDYEDREQTGQLYLSGTSAPGARIALYLDNRFIGSTKAGPDGSWDFAVTDILEAGHHELRADHVDLDRGDVLSRAEVRFDPEAVTVAAKQGGQMRTARNDASENLAQEQRLSKPLDDTGRQPQAPSGEAMQAEEPREQAVVVRRGDTLWHIAEQHYGSGVRYTKIFRNNRDQIRNPHRIYPGQHFELPQ